MDKDYVNRKIEKCEKLVEAATSEDQKKIYQGYLDYWNNFQEGYEENGYIIKTRKKRPDLLDEVLETKPIDFTIDEVSYANMFEIEHAPKKAYYSRGGETHKTKAFKEFLNQRTQ